MVTRVTVPGRDVVTSIAQKRIYCAGRNVLESPSEPIALRGEAVVPGTNEVGRDLAHVAAFQRGSFTHQVSPGVDLGPARRDRPEVHPLFHRIAVHMVDPGH